MSRATSDKTGRKTTSVAALVFDSRCESILMVRKRPEKNPEGQCGGWSLPGGNAEANQTALGALIWETESESGYPVMRVVGLLGEYPKGPLHTLLLYLVEVEDFPQRIKEQDEIAEAKFIPLREVLQMSYADRRMPDGVFFSVVNRVVDAVNALTTIDIEELSDAPEDAGFKQWLPMNQERLRESTRGLVLKRRIPTHATPATRSYGRYR